MVARLRFHSVCPHLYFEQQRYTYPTYCTFYDIHFFTNAYHYDIYAIHHYLCNKQPQSTWEPFPCLRLAFICIYGRLPWRYRCFTRYNAYISILYIWYISIYIILLHHLSHPPSQLTYTILYTLTHFLNLSAERRLDKPFNV